MASLRICDFEPPAPEEYEAHLARIGRGKHVYLQSMRNPNAQTASTNSAPTLALKALVCPEGSCPVPDATTPRGKLFPANLLDKVLLRADSGDWSAPPADGRMPMAGALHVRAVNPADADEVAWALQKAAYEGVSAENNAVAYFCGALFLHVGGSDRVERLVSPSVKLESEMMVRRTTWGVARDGERAPAVDARNDYITSHYLDESKNSHLLLNCCAAQLLMGWKAKPAEAKIPVSEVLQMGEARLQEIMNELANTYTLTLE
jgi:hypothetical protein